MQPPRTLHAPAIACDQMSDCIESPRSPPQATRRSPSSDFGLDSIVRWQGFLVKHSLRRGLTTDDTDKHGSGNGAGQDSAA